METLAKKSTLIIIVGIVMLTNLFFITNTRGVEKLMSLCVFAMITIPTTLKLIVFMTTPVKKTNRNVKQYRPTKVKFDNQPKEKYKIKKVETKGYEECRNIINVGVKQVLFKRQDILQIKDIIDDLLGANASNYRHFNFNNDMHEIYIKLKSKHLTTDNYSYITKFTSDLIDKNIEEELNYD